LKLTTKIIAWNLKNSINFLEQTFFLVTLAYKSQVGYMIHHGITWSVAKRPETRTLANIQVQKRTSVDVWMSVWSFKVDWPKCGWTPAENSSSLTLDDHPWASRPPIAFSSLTRLLVSSAGVTLTNERTHPVVQWKPAIRLCSRVNLSRFPSLMASTDRLTGAASDPQLDDWCRRKHETGSLAQISTSD